MKIEENIPIESKTRIISRDLIKEKAISFFLSKGVDKTSINDIVKASSIAKGTFYLYFENKDDLINSIFEVYGDKFFNEVVLKNKENPKITFLADSIINYFSDNQLFLIELRKNMSQHKQLPYYQKTMINFSKVILNFINFNDRYPISQVETYSEIIIGTILEISYRLIVDKSIKRRDEAKIMMEDFMKRFFDCESIF